MSDRNQEDLEVDIRDTLVEFIYKHHNRERGFKVHFVNGLNLTKVFQQKGTPETNIVIKNKRVKRFKFSLLIFINTRTNNRKSDLTYEILPFLERTK